MRIKRFLAIISAISVFTGIFNPVAVCAEEYTEGDSPAFIDITAMVNSSYQIIMPAVVTLKKLSYGTVDGEMAYKLSVVSDTYWDPATGKYHSKLSDIEIRNVNLAPNKMLRFVPQGLNPDVERSTMAGRLNCEFKDVLVNEDDGSTLDIIGDVSVGYAKDATHDNNALEIINVIAMDGTESGEYMIFDRPYDAMAGRLGPLYFGSYTKKYPVMYHDENGHVGAATGKEDKTHTSGYYFSYDFHDNYVLPYEGKTEKDKYIFYSGPKQDGWKYYQKNIHINNQIFIPEYDKFDVKLGFSGLYVKNPFVTSPTFFHEYGIFKNSDLSRLSAGKYSGVLSFEWGLEDNPFWFEDHP